HCACSNALHSGDGFPALVANWPFLDSRYSSHTPRTASSDAREDLVSHELTPAIMRSMTKQPQDNMRPRDLSITGRSPSRLSESSDTRSDPLDDRLLERGRRPRPELSAFQALPGIPRAWNTPASNHSLEDP